MSEATDLRTGQFLMGEITVEPLRNQLRRSEHKIVVEPKVMDLLVNLAAVPKAVQTRADLIDKVWGVHHGGDESPTRAVSGLRHAIDRIDPGKRYIETVPKRGYRLVVDVAPATGEGTQTNGASSSANRQKPQKLALIIIGVLLLFGILAASVLIRQVGDEADRLDRMIIASIDPNSSSPASIETAKVLEVALVRELTLSGVEVVRGTEHPDTVLRLTGSIASIGTYDVVTIQVEDSRSTQTLWSRQFELKGDVDAIVRNRIPWMVGDTLSCGVLGTSVQGKPLTDVKLVGFFIRSCGQFRADGNFGNLLVQSRRALAFEPENPVAKVRLAIAAGWAASVATTDEERRRLIGLAKETTDGLIDDYPDYGVAHYAKGIAYMAERDWISAREELLTAHDLSPEYPYTLNALSQITANLGYSKEALSLKRQAVITDRFSLIQSVQLAFMLAEIDPMPEALAITEGLKALDPQTACRAEFALHHWWGDALTAHAMIQNGCLGDDFTGQGRECVETFLKFRLGRESPATAFNACRNGALWPVERYAVATGFIDEAFSIAMKREIGGDNPWFLFRKEMRPLWSDPRFLDVAARYGLTKSWLESGQWPDFCSDPSLTYDCEAAAKTAGRATLS